MYYLAEKLVTALRRSNFSVIGTTFCGVLGVLGMVINLAGVLYLILLKTTKNDHLLLPETMQMAKELDNASIPCLPRDDIVNMQLPRTTSDVDKNVV